MIESVSEHGGRLIHSTPKLLVAAVLIAMATACGGDTTESATSFPANESTSTEFERSEPEPEEVGPEVGVDHWHAAFDLWACDRFDGPYPDGDVDLLGIHTHDDGLIHIHPFSPEAAGDNATLGIFTDQVGIELSDDSLTLPSGDQFENGEVCGDTEGSLLVVEWPTASNKSEYVVHTEELRSVRLREGAAYTIAFAAPDTDLEDLLPPSASSLVPAEVPGSIVTLPSQAPLSELCPDLAPAPKPNRTQPVEFRPVLENVYPPDCEPALDLYRDRNDMTYRLGPALPDGMVESAEVQINKLAGYWEVVVTARAGSPGIDDLNDIAEICFNQTPLCPAGQLAIVQGELVISAPVIQASEFARDAIVISGNLSEEEAQAIADALD